MPIRLHQPLKPATLTPCCSKRPPVNFVPKGLIKKVLKRGIRDVAQFEDRCVQRMRRGPKRATRAIPAIDDLPAQSALVVVAHPDDDVISSGALLARLSRAGVIWVTDGAPRGGAFAQDAGFDNWPDYALERRHEADAALALLGRDITPKYNLGITDRDVALDLVALARTLVRPLSSGLKYVITHAYEGGHPDHDATAFGVHAACALITRSGMTPPTIVEAPLYNAWDGVFRTRRFVPHEDAGPVLTLVLSDRERDLKRRMFECHATQRGILRDFGIDEEYFRVAPRYHFAVAPHVGDVGFNEYRWPVNGKRWRQRAWRAMRELDLVRELA